MKIIILFLLFPAFLFAQLEEISFNGKITKEVSMNYVIDYPENYKKSKQNWPLIIFLHGSGERGTDASLLSVHGPLKYLAEGNSLDAVVVAPQLKEGQLWEADELYELLKEIVLKNKIDISRVYLTGLSIGGLGTWDFAIAYPELFAAVAPICAPIDYGFPRQVYVLKDKPVWVFHGAKDTVVPVTSSEKMVDAIKAAGGSPKFTVDPEADHDSWSKPYSDPEFYAWLLAQEQDLSRK
ncbi:carboxylesterase family protein [Namhaeicola litoreus]|uniref:Prolyl oligopeptidase family serine peptidase n=1 Tax=Namhaeicola litoreus TaxID=1052145 RepID=A0ABW3Y0D7_9FLAO